MAASAFSKKPGATADAALPLDSALGAVTSVGSAHVVRTVQRCVGSVTVFSSPVVQSL
jgi:hypothetical protein